MGYELDKLKQQYGVSSPVRAPYTGPAAPVMPVMPTMPTKQSKIAQPSNLNQSYGYKNYNVSTPKNEESVTGNDLQAEYDKQKATYDAYVADPSAFNELMRKYELAQREYGQYRDEFSNRMMNTPMYGAEYDIGLPNTPTPVTYDNLLRAPDYAISDPSNALNVLTQMYENTLGRAPDQAGLDYWMGTAGADGIISDEERRQFQAAADQEIAARGSTDTDTNTFMPPSSTEAIKPFHRTNPLDVLLATRPGHDITARYNASQDATRSQFTPMPPPSPTEVIKPFHRTNPLDVLLASRPGHDITARYNASQDATGNYFTPMPPPFSTEAIKPFHRTNPLDVLSATRPGHDIMARYNASQDATRSYNVGGKVRRFKTGGNKGVEEDELETRFQAALTDAELDTVVNEIRERPPVSGVYPDESMRGSRAGLINNATEIAPTEATPVTTSPAVQPLAPPPATPTPVSPAAADLMSMLSRYDDKESVYGPELKAARARASAETDAFTQMISKAMEGDSEKPSKAEMYFRLAAAFGSPTKTGAFGENLALAGKEMADYSKDVRTAKKADKQLRMQLALEAQKIKSQTARDDLTTLRGLAGEEMKDKRALLTEYIKSGRPQSEAGKAAVDAGLKQGTPEFNEFVNNYIDDKIRSGNLFKEAMVAISAGQLGVARSGLEIRESAERRQQEASGKLTPKEVDLKVQAETTLGGLDDSMSSLKRAYELNPQTFDGTLAATAQRKLLEQTNPKDPRVLASREQSNLLSKGAVDKLRASFGGNPTEGERAALLALEGLDSKSKDERAKIMQNTYRLLKARRVREQKRLDEITKGSYRETNPERGID